MKPCVTPLDPIDIEALAASATPVIDPRAGIHAAACEACGGAVAAAREMALLFPEPPAEAPAGLDLAPRILRLRPFSAAERRSLRLWQAPLALSAALFAGGVVLLGPGLGLDGQAGLLAATAGALAGLARAASRWALDLTRTAPAALEGLSEAVRGSGSLGWLALLLLLPSGLGLRRLLARARR